MKQQKPAKKSKKPNIPFRRKVSILYYRVIKIIKLTMVLIVGLFFFTNYLDFIKHEFTYHFHEMTADLGCKLENVLIEGQHNTPAESILTTLDADTGTPLLSINITEVRTKLENIDWVKTAVVERRMPRTIYIALLERKPIAIWQVNRQLFLIDEEGYKITSNSHKIEEFSHLLHVVGTDANIYADKLIKDLSHYPELATKVISAVRYGERRWNLNLEQNIIAKMPETDFEGALIYLTELNKAGKLFNQNYKTLDLRDPNKYYIERF